MPVFKNHTAFKVARDAAAFLFLEAGLTRGGVPDPEVSIQKMAEQARALSQAHQRIQRLENEINPSGVDPANIVWIFGTVRTGSTWLASMMASVEDSVLWNEPRVGELFGTFFYERANHRKTNENFVMGLDRKLEWLKSIRMFVLSAVGARYPRLTREQCLIIKEPSGSVGAPLLMEALPESRMVLLVRDPRDVVASALDAAREGSWAYQLKGNKRLLNAPTVGVTEQPDAFVNKRPDELLRDQSDMYLRYVGKSKEAYDSHEGPKALVRYEDLRSDAFGTMKRLYSDLEIAVDEDGLARSVEAHSWENVPEEEKGEGKFHRKAKPGGWREDLTAEQVKMVEEITAPLLGEFYGG